MIARYLIILGRVQGVGFRDALCVHARSAGVLGWVRNRRDGAVEALLQGPEAAVERVITWARRGPPFAHVTELTATPGEVSPALRRFSRLPTA